MCDETQDIQGVAEKCPKCSPNLLGPGGVDRLLNPKEGQKHY